MQCGAAIGERLAGATNRAPRSRRGRRRRSRIGRRDRRRSRARSRPRRNRAGPLRRAGARCAPARDCAAVARRRARASPARARRGGRSRSSADTARARRHRRRSRATHTSRPACRPRRARPPARPARHGKRPNRSDARPKPATAPGTQIDSAPVILRSPSTLGHWNQSRSALGDGVAPDVEALRRHHAEVDAVHLSVMGGAQQHEAAAADAAQPGLDHADRERGRDPQRRPRCRRHAGCARPLPQRPMLRGDHALVQNSTRPLRDDPGRIGHVIHGDSFRTSSRMLLVLVHHPGCRSGCRRRR